MKNQGPMQSDAANRVTAQIIVTQSAGLYSKLVYIVHSYFYTSCYILFIQVNLPNWIRVIDWLYIYMG